jgi:hypothetical protein
MGGEQEYCEEDIGDVLSGDVRRQLLWEGDAYWVREGTTAPPPQVPEDDW